MFWSLVRPDRIVPPITRSAAVTTSLEAGELAVRMIKASELGAALVKQPGIGRPACRKYWRTFLSRKPLRGGVLFLFSTPNPGARRRSQFAKPVLFLTKSV